MKTTRKEIESLVYLLDDPDLYVQESVMNRIFDIGDASVPLLDEIRAKSKDENQRKQIHEIIHNLTFDGFVQDFLNFLEGGMNSLDDLEEGIFMLSRFDEPTIRTLPLKHRLDEFALEIQRDIFKADSNLSRMEILIRFLYTQKGFEGCHSDYLNPRHSFLHYVIPNRVGIPLSLALVLLFLSRRLKLPFYGVNMPLHFLVGFETESGKMLLIDPFNGGGILTKEQCRQFLKKSGIEPKELHFQKAAEIEMFIRFIRNLINGYQQQQQMDKVKKLSKLLGYIEALSY